MRQLTKLCAAGLWALLLATGADEARAQRAPNILLFIGDDVDFSYYGAQGHEFAQTPNIDRLAAEGVLFESGYAPASVCKPAHQALLAGVQPYTWERMAADIRSAYPGTARYRESQFVSFTLPRLLRQAGYTSFAGGKMWEGTFADAGFDAGTMVAPPTAFSIDGALTFGRESMAPLFDFIDAQSGPWFAWVAPVLPHVPFDPPQDLKDLYAGLGLTAPAINYFANLTRMDQRVGEILDFLDARNLTEDTVVIYLSDNGWEQPLYELVPFSGLAGDDRGKLSVHDRGFRTPVVVRWPEEILPGGWSDRLVSFADVFETILDYGEVASHPCSEGESFRHLADDGRGAWQSRQAFARVEQVRYPIRDVAASRADADPGNDLPTQGPTLGLYLRDGRRWAYSFVPARGVEELYDLRRDPLGLVDISASRPARVRAMRRRAVQSNGALVQARCAIAP